MKTYITKITLLLSFVLLLSNCKKFGKTFDTYFFTDIENSTGALTLFIDGQEKGGLPNLKTSVAINNDTVIEKALHLSLKPGKYTVEAKDSQGAVRSAGTIKFNSASLHISGGIGGISAASSNDIVVVKLSF